MGYIGSDPKNNESVSTSQLVDDSVTNAKIVDNVLFTSVTSSIVSASGNITADTFTGTFNGALSSSVQIATSISGSSTSLSSSLSTRATTLESASGSFASDLVTLKGSGTAQGVGTSDSPTFADATITGTLTAQEVHTEFESASILFTSGSTQFGNSGDDIHNMTGSIRVSGSLANESFILGHNLGIGTNNPSNLLHLEFNDDSDVFTAARITDNSVSGILINNLDTGNGHGGMLKFANKDGDNHTAIAHSQDGNTDASLLFYSMDGGSLAEVMRVDHTHRLGIGNGSPSYKLDVTENAETNVVRFFNDGGDQNRDVMILQGGADAGPGNTRFITFNDGNGGAFGFIQGPADGATAGISFNTTADTALLTLSGSQVGIGTNNPQTGRLHIHNGDSGATSYVQLTQDGTGTSGTNGLLVGVNAAEASIIYNGENTPLIFYTNASERVRIDNSGNVGIGTNNPGVQLDIYNTDHAVMRLLAGTNKSASMRLKNDNQDWDVNCQTTDNFAIYDQTGGSAALIIESGGYNATFSGDVQISKSNAKLLVFDSTVGNKESIVIDRNTANGDDYQEIRWKLQGTNYPGGYIRHDYEDTNNSNLYFGVRDSGTPGTALTIDNSKNATFASMVKASFFRTDSQATSVANATWTDLNGLTNLSAGLYIIHAYKDNYAANDWSARGIVEATGHSTIDGDFENQSGFQLRVNGNDVQLYHTLGSTFGITVSWIKIG